MHKYFLIVGGFITFDILTGILKALHNRNLDSSIMRKGLFSKLAEIISCVGSALLERGVSEINLGVELPLFSVVAAYICVMELISCIENICVLNDKLCALFAPYLKKLKVGGKNDEEGN